MVARSGLFVDPVPGTPPTGTSMSDGRRVLGALLGTTFQVLSGGGVSSSGTVMQFTVAQTVWGVPDPTDAANVFASPSDSTVLTGTAGPGSGSRIDSIATRQNNISNSDADSRMSVILVAGTASGSPIAPTLPAGYQRYANIAVPTSAANAAACTVTILVQPTVLASMTWLSPNYAALATIPAPNVPTQQARTLDVGTTYQYFALYNSSTNPGGAKTAGWWPVGGVMPGGIQVRSATAQTLGTSAYTVLPAAAFSETLAGGQRTAGFATSFATNGGWTVPLDGVYDVAATLLAGSAGNVILLVKKNDATATATGQVLQNGGATATSAAWVSISGRVALNSGDILRLAVYAAAAATIAATPEQISFSCRYVEPLRQ